MSVYLYTRIWRWRMKMLTKANLIREMGERKRKWTKRKELALPVGVAKYGFGKWKKIKKDPEFSLRISERANETLKEKWRPILKSASLTPNVKNPSPIDSDLANRESDVRDASRYYCNALVFEAISTINDGKGAQFIEIFNFIKERYKVRKAFKRQLIYRLNRLVSRKRLIKSYPKLTVFTRHHKKEHSWKKKHRTKELMAQEAVREADDEAIKLQLALEIVDLCLRSELEFMEKSFAS